MRIVPCVCLISHEIHKKTDKQNFLMNKYSLINIQENVTMTLFNLGKIYEWYAGF